MLNRWRFRLWKLYRRIWPKFSAEEIRQRRAAEWDRIRRLRRWSRRVYTPGPYYDRHSTY